jgi:hypothetical protein
VQVARCDDRARCLTGSGGSTILSFGYIAANGAFTLTPNAASAARELLVFEAEIEPARNTAYRVMTFGPLARPGGGIGSGTLTLDGILLGPSADAAVRLLEETGLERFADEDIEELLDAVDISNAETDFAGLDAAEASDLATEIASEDPEVQAIIERATTDATPTPSPAPTATSTATFTAIPGGDRDGDGLPDSIESLLGLDPDDSDSDDDGVADGAEDSDRDRLSNTQEIASGTDPSRPDSDGDQWPDGTEVDEGSNPLGAASMPAVFLTTTTGVLVPGPSFAPIAGVVSSGPSYAPVVGAEIVP